MATIIGKCSKFYHSKHLVCCYVVSLEYFHPKVCFRTSDTSATPNDLFNVHVVFTCDIAIFP